MTQHTIAILGFHKIGPPPPGGWESWFYVSEETFTAFVTDLADCGFEVIDSDRFLRGLTEPETLPPRSALLTFDDGYRSMRGVALPVLKRLAVPSVLFVPTNYIGGWNSFDGGVEPDEAICDWDDLRELAAGGVSVQSHAASHRRLSELSAEQRESEVVSSKTILEEGLGTPVDMIAFPYGDPGTPTDNGLLRKCGYRAAFLYGGGVVRMPAADPYRLQRIAIGPDTDLRAELRRTN